MHSTKDRAQPPGLSTTMPAAHTSALTFLKKMQEQYLSGSSVAHDFAEVWRHVTNALQALTLPDIILNEPQQFYLSLAIVDIVTHEIKLLPGDTSETNYKCLQIAAFINGCERINPEATELNPTPSEEMTMPPAPREHLLTAPEKAALRQCLSDGFLSSNVILEMTKPMKQIGDGWEFNSQLPTKSCPKEDLITHLIDFVEAHGRIGELLEQIRVANPFQYRLLNGILDRFLTSYRSDKDDSL